MVKKNLPKPRMETVDKFAKGGGYEIVRFRPDGRLRGVARAHRELHISEMTIRGIMAHFPTPPEQKKQNEFARIQRAMHARLTSSTQAYLQRFGQRIISEFSRKIKSITYVRGSILG